MPKVNSGNPNATLEESALERMRALSILLLTLSTALLAFLTNSLEKPLYGGSLLTVLFFLSAAPLALSFWLSILGMTAEIDRMIKALRLHEVPSKEAPPTMGLSEPVKKAYRWLHPQAWGFSLGVTFLVLYVLASRFQH